MGHGDTSEGFGGTRGIRDADDGFVAPAQGNYAVTGMIDDQAGTQPKLAEKSWPVRTALYALRFYKAYLSLLLAGSCRYEPTCSQFAYGAIERFGVVRGSWLGLKRLLRCQPFSRRFGFDPVPEEWPGKNHRHALDHGNSADCISSTDNSSNNLSNHKEAHS